MVGGKPTQDNSLRNYRHQLSCFAWKGGIY